MADELSVVCEFAGHEWEDAGGGLEICVECQVERWAERDGEPAGRRSA
jgi:hypothetical protein